MNIGFDLDRIFIDNPPLIPRFIIDWLYRNHCTNRLSYRFPKGKGEQVVRKFSHIFLFRPQIKQNIEFVQQLAQTNHQLFLISSRYKFLEDLTKKLLEKYQIFKSFHSINLNLDNRQPHLFKEKIINQLKINLFVDDDLELLKYLKNKCPKTKLLWYNPFKDRQSPEGIIHIRDLSEIKAFLK